MRNVLVLGFGVAVAAAVLWIFSMYFSGGSAMHGGVPGAGGPAMLAGAPAQSYTIKRLDGADDSLDHYRGKIVWVNLWASWCAPCRSETPALEQLFESERSRGLIVLGIDQGESLSVAQNFAKDLKLQYPILVDTDQQYGRAYESVGLPTSVIVDRSGHVVRGVDGELTLAQMRDAVAPLLRAQ